MTRQRSHRRGAFVAVATLCLGVVGAGARAQTPSAAAIVTQGSGNGAPACVSCHGPQLLGNPVLGYPRLAGLSAPYIEAQLAALAAGTRKNAVMLPVASALTAGERKALAAYISALPVPASLSAPPDSAPFAHPSSAQVALGRLVATRGRWTSGLPACDQCHGPGGVGVGDAFPPLAGQSALYLTNQLQAWKQETRPPGPLNLMTAVVQRMSEADIAGVAAYYPTLPLTPADSTAAHGVGGGKGAAAGGGKQ